MPKANPLVQEPPSSKAEAFLIHAVRRMPAAVRRVASLLAAGRESATLFQLHVWAACSLVPRGRVCSYGSLARIVGVAMSVKEVHQLAVTEIKGMVRDPSLVLRSRAVGRALGENPLAPRIPCHRIVGCDGKMTGFGHQTSEAALLKKAELLKSEGVPVAAQRGASHGVLVRNRSKIL